MPGARYEPGTSDFSRRSDSLTIFLSHPPCSFWVMEWERDFSVDALEQRVVSDYRLMAMLSARIMGNLELLDRAQVFTGDGSRNLSEWLAARADISHDTARAVVRTTRRTVDKPWLREALATGNLTFDRVEALSKIHDDVGTLTHLDVAGVHRTAADRARVNTADETTTTSERFLILEPSLDESWWRLSGGLDGLAGAVIDKVLTEKADDLPELPDNTQPGLGWRKATALYELANGDTPPPAQITVFVDGDKAVETNGETGIRLQAGPRVGAQALTAVLCDAVTEITVNTKDGTPLAYGRTTSSIPPKLRRATLATTGGYCAADGCNSRYRVEVHHKTPWSQGGRTDPDNLIPLCWYHHHIIIHERGYEIYPDPDHGRIRFRKPPTKTRPPPRQPKG